MIMFCFYYLLTDRHPLEVAAKNCFLTDMYMSGFRSQQTFSLDSQSTPCQAWTFILFYKIIFGEGFLLMMLTNN